MGAGPLLGVGGLHRLRQLELDRVTRGPRSRVGGGKAFASVLISWGGFAKLGAILLLAGRARLARLLDSVAGTAGLVRIPGVGATLQAGISRRIKGSTGGPGPEQRAHSGSDIVAEALDPPVARSPRAASSALTATPSPPPSSLGRRASRGRWVVGQRRPWTGRRIRPRDARGGRRRGRSEPGRRLAIGGSCESQAAIRSGGSANARLNPTADTVEPQPAARQIRACRPCRRP